MIELPTIEKEKTFGRGDQQWSFVKFKKLLIQFLLSSSIYDYQVLQGKGASIHAL